ncbi:MAG: glycosyltransferase [Aeromicrobium sp.]|uniref:glycosyltransferase n=1 Tax=Aeromicrobium sp. TaxID=1871063 RepID=UPI0039E6920C
MAQATVIQRTVFPQQSALDAVALYVDTGAAVTLKPSSKGQAKDVAVSVVQSGGDVNLGDFLSRHSMVVRAGTRVSYASLFNAFPASYWNRWTTVERVTLRVRTRGDGSIILMKSNARGTLQMLELHRVNGESEVLIDADLSSFGDGGWLWFDLLGGDGDLVLESAEWLTEAPPRERPRVMIQMTTMDKPDYCLANLRRLGEASEVLGAIDEILLVDQGRKKVAEANGFSDAAAALGGRLRIIDQTNIGGSGGFARGMYEAVQGDFDYVLLMDDDVEMETESLPRMLAMAQFAKTPLIVGGLMFDIYNRSTLHTLGEVVNPWRFFWVNAHESMESAHNLAASNLRQTPWLHRRFDVDYNAWWMCLIPTAVIREVGLSLPVFIKWDDAEFGVRAKAHGFPTVTMPGTGVWHVSWVDKDDTVGWQAYFHARNRVIAALLHSPYEDGGRVSWEWMTHTVRHLLSLQYGTVVLRNMALRDVMAGPEALKGLLATKLQDVRGELAHYSDSRMEISVDDFPPAGVSKPPRRGGGFKQPPKALLAPWTMKNFLRQSMTKVEDERERRPQTHLPHQDNKWWLVSQFDSALVSNAEGTAVSWYKRDPEKARTLMRESSLLYWRLRKEWGDLSKRYRESLAEITSFDSWAEVFETNTIGDRRY